MPWIDTRDSEFVQALEDFWNGWASRRQDILFIASGSATSWMVDNLIDNQGGLHDRIETRLYLLPFTLHDTETYLRSRHFSWDRYQILQTYMTMGGIPYYLSLLKPGESLVQNIDRLNQRRHLPACRFLHTILLSFHRGRPLAGRTVVAAPFPVARCQRLAGIQLRTHLSASPQANQASPRHLRHGHRSLGMAHCRRQKEQAGRCSNRPHHHPCRPHHQPVRDEVLHPALPSDIERRDRIARTRCHLPEGHQDHPFACPHLRHHLRCSQSRGSQHPAKPSADGRPVWKLMF